MSRLTYLILALVLGAINLAAIGFLIVYSNGGQDNSEVLILTGILWIPILLVTILINFVFFLCFLFPAANVSRFDPEDWVKGKKKSSKRSRRRNPVLHFLYEVLDEVFD